MSSTYSPILRSELIGAGDQAGAWGNTTNSNFQYVFESAIAGYVPVTVSPTANNQVLTYVNGPSASPALDQSIYALLKLNAGTLGANFNIFCPPVSKTYTVWNNTSYTASFYNSTVIGNTTPGGSATVIPAGAKVTIWSDSFSFYTANDTTIGNYTVTGNLTVSGSTTLGTPLAAGSGGTGVSSLGSGVATALGQATSGSGGIALTVSPALTGAPTAPTAAPGTSTTQLATTEFVQNVAGALGTMSSQNANSVNISGGAINNVSGTANSLNVGYAINATNATNATNAGTATNANQFQGKTKLGLGITGEVWNDVTSSRAQSVTYTNSNAYPISVSICFGTNNDQNWSFYVNGVRLGFLQEHQDFNAAWMGGIVPPGGTYVFYGNYMSSWAELY